MMYTTSQLFYTIMLFAVIWHGYAKKTDEERLISALFQSYNRGQPPIRGQSTKVKIGVHVNSFHAINENTMDYSLSMYLRQSWRDPRLAFDSGNGMTEINLDGMYIDNVWLPDTFIRNLKEAFYHDITVPNKMLKISADGNIWYVTKITATLSCPMDFHKYPFDSQSCPMIFESFKYKTDVIQFEWMENAVEVDESNLLPKFFPIGTLNRDCSRNYTAGSYPCLEVKFLLQRDIHYFIIQVYMPCVFMVLLSWASFWCSPEALSARTLFGLVPMLVIVTSSWCVNTTLPQVSCIKALDVWTGSCFLFVFASLVELVVVAFMSRKKESNLSKRTETVDMISRAAFPAAFLLFNIIYWAAYFIK